MIWFAALFITLFSVKLGMLWLRGTGLLKLVSSMGGAQS